MVAVEAERRRRQACGRRGGWALRPLMTGRWWMVLQLQRNQVASSHQSPLPLSFPGALVVLRSGSAHSAWTPAAPCGEDSEEAC